jgi:dTDP-4-dehydrorhamnose 3,5-epimerase
MAKRDNPGPKHSPALVPTVRMDGVIVQTAPRVFYETDSVLTEFHRKEWAGVFASGEEISHLYTVYAPSGGIRKEWYFHEHTTDRYVVLLGKLDLGLYDARPDSPTNGEFKVVSLGGSDSDLPNLIRIPPGVWHSLRWETPSGMFLNSKTPPYKSEKPDKFRVSPEDYPPAIKWNV